MLARFLISVAIGAAIVCAQPANRDLFRLGRDSMDGGNWASAERYFSEYRKQYPKAPNSDAALYYLAFTLKKLSRFQEAAVVADSLIREHPRSGWVEDARAMKAELAAKTGDRSATEQALRSGDDRVKSVALQTLIRENPEQARAEITRILEPTSTASDRLQAFCLQLLAKEGSSGISILIQTARNGSRERVRGAAVEMLSRLSSDEAKASLEELAIRDEGRVAEWALVGLKRSSKPPSLDFLRRVRLQSRSVFARAVAVTFTGLILSDAAFTEVTAAYESSQDLLVREYALDALWRMKTPRASDYLKRVTATSDRPELRAAASYFVSPRGSSEATAALRQWLSSEGNEDVRLVILWLLKRQSSSEADQAIKAFDTPEMPARLATQARALLYGGDIKVPLTLGQDPLPLEPQRIF